MTGDVLRPRGKRHWAVLTRGPRQSETLLTPLGPRVGESPSRVSPSLLNPPSASLTVGGTKEDVRVRPSMTGPGRHNRRRTVSETLTSPRRLRDTGRYGSRSLLPHQLRSPQGPWRPTRRTRSPSPVLSGSTQTCRQTSDREVRAPQSSLSVGPIPVLY